MIDVAEAEKTFSPQGQSDDEVEHYESVAFDPEDTFVDDEIDSDTLAFRDAVRDICASEGSFQLLLPT